MMISISCDDLKYEVNVAKAIPIYLTFGEYPWRCFGINALKLNPLYSFDENGCGCAADEITFCPHSSGTHFESKAHVIKNDVKPTHISSIILPIMYSILVDFNAIDDLKPSKHVKAVIIRFGLVEACVRSGEFDFTGTNPAFVEPSVIDHLQSIYTNLQVLLVDLPSVDPETDGGKLEAHKRFFAGINSLGIIELCHLRSTIEPGYYGLAINMASFNSDACPCSPILYPLCSK